MKFGYARLSTADQDTRAQQAEILLADRGRVCREVGHRGRLDHPELYRLLDHPRPGAPLIAGRAAADMVILVGVSRSTPYRLRDRIPRNEVFSTSLRR